jgi:DNA-binding response OmpR family regulator
VELTAREYALLEFLAFRSGEVVTRRDIEDHLYDERSFPVSNAVDRAICSLRAKLGDGDGGGVIRTRRGIGYVLLGDPP